MRKFILKKIINSSTVRRWYRKYNIPVEKEEYKESVIQVCLQPEEKHIEIPRKKAKNVERLLIHLGIRPYTALVARDGIPLTPDVPLLANQNILVRKVMSSG